MPLNELSAYTSNKEGKKVLAVELHVTNLISHIEVTKLMKSDFLLMYVIVQIRKENCPYSPKYNPNDQVTSHAVANPKLQQC